MVRIAAADDDPAIRDIFEVLFAPPRFAFVGAAPDGAAAVELVRSSHPDVLVLDYEMPELDGAGVASVVRAELPALRIVIFSDARLEHATTLEVDLIVPKSAGPRKLVEAVASLVGA